MIAAPEVFILTPSLPVSHTVLALATSIMKASGLLASLLACSLCAIQCSTGNVTGILVFTVEEWTNSLFVRNQFLLMLLG